MVAWVGLICLLAVLVIQVRVDSRIWGGGATPAVLLTGGFAGSASIYAIGTLFYTFNDIHAFTYVFLCLASILLIGVSFAVSRLVSWRPCEAQPHVLKTGLKVRLILIAVTGLYGFMAIRAATSSGGLWSSESMAVLSAGVIGHLSVVLAFCLIWYSIGTTDRKRVRLPMMAVSLFVMSFNPVKGWTLIPLMALVLAEMGRRPAGKLKAAPLLVGGILGVCVFVLIYLSRALTGGGDADLLFVALGEIAKHFVFYSTAGLFGLDAVLQGLHLNGGLEVLFAPFVNIYDALVGENYVAVISDVYIMGIQDGGDGGNVYSMYGTLVAYTNLLVGSFLAAVVVAAVYVVRACAFRFRSSSGLVASNYFSAILMFGWFEYYFQHLTPFEVLFYTCFLGVTEVALREVSPSRSQGQQLGRAR